MADLMLEDEVPRLRLLVKRIVPTSSRQESALENDIMMPHDADMDTKVRVKIMDLRAQPIATSNPYPARISGNRQQHGKEYFRVEAEPVSISLQPQRTSNKQDSLQAVLINIDIRLEHDQNDSTAVKKADIQKFLTQLSPMGKSYLRKGKFPNLRAAGPLRSFTGDERKPLLLLNDDPAGLKTNFELEFNLSWEVPPKESTERVIAKTQQRRRPGKDMQQLPTPVSVSPATTEAGAEPMELDSVDDPTSNHVGSRNVTSRKNAPSTTTMRAQARGITLDRLVEPCSPIRYTTDQELDLGRQFADDMRSPKKRKRKAPVSPAKPMPSKRKRGAPIKLEADDTTEPLQRSPSRWTKEDAPKYRLPWPDPTKPRPIYYKTASKQPMDPDAEVYESDADIDEDWSLQHVKWRILTNDNVKLPQNAKKLAADLSDWMKAHASDVKPPTDRDIASQAVTHARNTGLAKRVDQIASWLGVSPNDKTCIVKKCKEESCKKKEHMEPLDPEYDGPVTYQFVAWAWNSLNLAPPKQLPEPTGLSTGLRSLSITDGSEENAVAEAIWKQKHPDIIGIHDEPLRIRARPSGNGGHVPFERSSSWDGYREASITRTRSQDEPKKDKGKRPARTSVPDTDVDGTNLEETMFDEPMDHSDLYPYLDQFIEPLAQESTTPPPQSPIQKAYVKRNPVTGPNPNLSLPDTSGPSSMGPPPPKASIAATSPKRKDRPIHADKPAKKRRLETSNKRPLDPEKSKRPLNHEKIETGYCVCGNFVNPNEPLVYCAHNDCVRETFHPECVGVTGRPTDWYCDTCPKPPPPDPMTVLTRELRRKEAKLRQLTQGEPEK